MRILHHGLFLGCGLALLTSPLRAAEPTTSETLLKLASERASHQSDAERRRAHFPALAVLPPNIDLLVATGNLDDILSDWYSRYARASTPYERPLPDVDGYALAASSGAIMQWLDALELGKEGNLDPVFLELWRAHAKEGFSQALETYRRERQDLHLRIIQPLSEPLYLGMNLREEASSAQSIRESLVALIGVILQRHSVIYSTQESEGESIITIDWQRTIRRYLGESRDLPSLFKSCPLLESLHIVLSDHQRQLRLVVTPRLDRIAPVDNNAPLLHSSRLDFSNGRLEGTPYWLSWFSKDFLKRSAPSLRLKRFTENIGLLLNQLANHSRDEQTKNRLLQATIALRVNTQALRELVPDFTEDASMIIWSDQDLRMEYATGLEPLYREGELRHLHLSDNPETVIYAEGTRLPNYSTGTGPVKFTLNCFHILEGIMASLESSKIPQLQHLWGEMQTKYFPSILQASSGLRDISRGVSSMGGLHLTRSSAAPEKYDWMLFAHVDDFASMSSGWSQLLNSMQKMIELFEEKPLREPIFASTVAPDNSVQYVLTPPQHLHPHQLHIQASSQHVTAGTRAERDLERYHSQAIPFIGGLFALDFALLDKLLEDASWKSPMQLSQYFGKLYLAVTQQRGQLRVHAKITPH